MQALLIFIDSLRFKEVAIIGQDMKTKALTDYKFLTMWQHNTFDLVVKVKNLQKLILHAIWFIIAIDGYTVLFELNSDKTPICIYSFFIEDFDYLMGFISKELLNSNYRTGFIFFLLE